MSQLQSYVDLERSKGFSDSQIRQILLKAGHNEQEVDTALARPGLQKVIYLISAILFIGLIIGALYYWTTQEVYRGFEYYDEGDYAKAEAIFSKNVDNDPLSMKGMALISLRRNDTASAEVHLTKMNNLGKFTDSRIMLAYIYRVRGDYDQAIQILQDGVSNKCTSLMILGLDEEKKGNHDQAVSYYEHVHKMPECQNTNSELYYQ